MLGVTLSRDARARAVQLPAWNEALGLPRPWDQQWSLRLQQVLAYETDLLEYDDLFTGSVVVERKVAELVEGAHAEMARVQEMGGAVAAVESGYMKGRLVASLAERRRRIESGDDVVVGVNRFQATEPNPLLADLDAAIQVVDPAVETAACESVLKWRAKRDPEPVERALARLRAVAGTEENLMAATLECARDAGFEVVYQGIRLTPAQIVSAAVEEDVHVVGLSVLSGSHLQVVPAVLQGVRNAGLDDVPVVVGGVRADSDARRLRELGVARVFTPKDFGLTDIMGQIVDVVREANEL